MGLRFVSAEFPGVLRWLESGRDEDLWDLSVLKDGQRAEIPEAEAYGVGAWHPGYEPVYRAVRNMGASFGVAWSSSPQESDTARTREELAYLMMLTSSGSGMWVNWWACLHPALAEVLPNGVHLPAPIHLEPSPAVSREDWIGFFIPPVEKKAVFAQLMAVRHFQKQTRGAVLHTNLEAYKGVMDWLGLEYVLHPWLPRTEYLRLLSRCRVVLHASLAESFGYGAVDAMMMGARVVGSPAMGWLPTGWRAVDANDPRAVAGTLEWLWRSPSEPEPREWVVRLAEQNNAAAAVAVGKILGGRHK